MQIAFFGSSLLSAWWNGAATYYRGLIRALHERGHRITFYEPDALGRQDNRDMNPPDWARVVVYADDEAAAREMLADARHADVVIKASGVGVHDALLEAGVPDLKRADNVVAFWDVDAPATLERLHDDSDDPFRAQIPRYDLVLTYGGGPRVVSAYEAFGARRCVPIYNALDPETHFPEPTAAEYDVDLAFVGNRLPDREQRVERFFLEAVRRCPDRRFLIGGNGWPERNGMPPNVRVLGHIYTRDHNAINASATCVLNISRDSMARFGYSPATRVFEAAGAGACVVTDAWRGVEHFFEPGTEILVAEDGAEVADIVRTITPQQARRIGDAALARVRAEHTYAQRAVETETVLRERMQREAPA
ncbi:CgeB family protein [Salinisphaera sp.]|uniref:CgeB family protein n=1 Tax=Salinisphaera sp. TaxID=1914330 RepID=UPI002D7997BA|nr:glycosyltransferase [Salinisphaera sp.]HET7315745.1 glycosyltransferase [Salinisphaera sp.]